MVFTVLPLLIVSFHTFNKFSILGHMFMSIGRTSDIIKRFLGKNSCNFSVTVIVKV